MARGRKRLPDNIKLIQGTHLASPTMNPDRPQYKSGTLTPPDHLSKPALEMWDRVAEMLDAAGVIEQADYTAMQMLAEAYGEWRTADINVQLHGAIYDAVNIAGEKIIRANPAVGQRSDAARRLQSLLAEFGLTPASRSKVTVKDKDKADDPAARYFG